MIIRNIELTNLKRILCLIMMLSSYLFSLNVIAATQAEINHLLSFVQNTNCQYERNGSFHNGQDALKHISKKYQYYADDIKTSEDFIKYSATKSKMSGNYYHIHCADKPVVKSKDWLLAELMRYRLKDKKQ